MNRDAGALMCWFQLKPATRFFSTKFTTDRAAFDAHLKTPHFDMFNRESEALVLSKNVAQYTLVCEGSHRL